MQPLQRKTSQKSYQQAKGSRQQNLWINASQQREGRERGRTYGMGKEISKMNKSTNNEEKISLVNKNLTHIDLVGNGWGERVKTLYLSNNNIWEIKNITQFPNLEHLSLSNNNISSITNIRYLRDLPRLTHLSLEANPLTNHPLYQPYVYGNCLSLKILDQKPLSQPFHTQLIQYWNRYQAYMEQLQNKYLTLIHLFQFFKKIACHLTLQKAFSQSYLGQNTQLGINRDQMAIKIQLCLQKTFECIKFFPPQYTLSLEQSLLTDIHRISSNGHSFISESGIRSRCPIEIFFSSMQRLLEGQQNKIKEVKQKIISKYCISFGRSSDSTNQFLPPTLRLGCTDKGKNDEGGNEDIQRISQILKYAFEGKRKEILYFQWKLVEKCLGKLKSYSQSIKVKRNTANRLFKVLVKLLFKRNKNAFTHIIERMKSKRVKNGCAIFEKMANQDLRNAFANLKTANQMQIRGKRYLQGLKKRQMLRRIWKSWMDVYRADKIQKQNRRLKNNMDEQNEKQKRYLSKIKLLEQLLFLTEGKLKAYEQNIDLNIQRSDPRLLLQQLEQQMKSKKIKNPSPQSSKIATFKSPSPAKAIRKNSPINLNQDNITHKNFFQRKFNSSQNNLRI